MRLVKQVAFVSSNHLFDDTEVESYPIRALLARIKGEKGGEPESWRRGACSPLVWRGHGEGVNHPGEIVFEFHRAGRQAQTIKVSGGQILIIELRVKESS
jgi:hypothetical protein